MGYNDFNKVEQSFDCSNLCFRRSKVMRVIGLLASHCTELRDDVPVTEVRLVCLCVFEA